MRTILDYEITEEDLKSATKLPWNDILQLRYTKDKSLSFVYDMFRSKVREFVQLYREKKIDIEKFNYLVYEYRVQLIAEYPDYFPAEDDIGYFQKKTLVTLWLEGALTIEENKFARYQEHLANLKKRAIEDKKAREIQREIEEKAAWMTERKREFLYAHVKEDLRVNTAYTLKELYEAYEHMWICDEKGKIQQTAKRLQLENFLSLKKEGTRLTITEIKIKGKPIAKQKFIHERGGLRRIDILSYTPEAVEWRDGKTVEQLLIEYNFF